MNETEAESGAGYTSDYVDTPAALDVLCQQLKSSSWIALDTEFMREKTYYPRLCLLQVANTERVACIDPLALEDLTPLLDILYDREIVKVLHAAQQDLEIFFYLRQALPEPVFDTQIAATLLGYGEQVGYAALVQDMLGVSLSKSQTRTDWSNRPLAADQLDYASDDVYYLGQIYTRMHNELARRARLEWLAEDFAALGDVRRYFTEPDNAWLRVKGYKRLRGVRLAVLGALAAWRERESMCADKPRRWILGDDSLLDLAQRMPDSVEQLSKLRSLQPAKINRYGDTLLELIAAASDLPRENWPRMPQAVQINADQEPLLDALQAIIRMQSMRYEVSVGSLAGRKDLEKLLSGDTDIPLLHGWRAALAGDAVQAFLAGSTRLVVRDNLLSLESLS